MKLKFQHLWVNSFARIDSETHASVSYPSTFTPDDLQNIDADTGIVIMIPDDHRFIQIEGDQGVGKSSLINFIIECSGGKTAVNGVNLKEKSKTGQIRFIGKNGKLYEAVMRTNNITLYEIETAEDGTVKLNQRKNPIRKEVGSPKTMLREIIGPAGISPHEIAAKDPADQVTWIRDLFQLSQDVLKAEKELDQKITKEYNARTAAGREYKSLEARLKANEYYIKFEYWQDHLEKNKPVLKQGELSLEDQAKTIAQQKEEYAKGETLIEQLKKQVENANISISTIDSEIADIDNQIKLLQQRRVEKENAKKTQEAQIKFHNERIRAGNVFLETHKDIKKRAEELELRIKDANQYNLDKQAFDLMYADKVEMDKKSDEYTRLTGKVDALREEKKKFIASFTPAIPDFEVCIKDEDEPREGLYYKGMPISHLSESEQWEWYSLFCEALGVNIIIVDNISNLGSHAVEKFNEFLAKGAYIFGTAMNRKKKEMCITFETSITE